MSKIIHIVLYHARCPDGTASAWVLWHFAKEKECLDGVRFIPVTHGEAPP